MKGIKVNRKIAGFLVFVLLLTPIITYLPAEVFNSWAFNLAFVSSGQAGHPYLKGKAPGDTRETWFFCMNQGASAHSNYDYSKVDADVNYGEGTIEQKRMFWAYIGAFGSYDGKTSLNRYFGWIDKDTARESAWTKGKSDGGSEWIEKQANDGFMSLENIPPGCKSPKEILNLISKYNSAGSAMYINDLKSGPGQIDTKKLYELCGISDWETFRKYCSIEAITPGLVINTEAQNLSWSFPEIPAGQKPSEAVLKITYDPTVFKVLKVTGRLEFFQCSVPGSQQLYRAKGNVEEKNCEFFLTTKYSADTSKTDNSGDGEASLKTYRHSETFESNYKVELEKRDYETGNPLKDSTWQVLEHFDDSQLSEDECDGGIIKENMKENPAAWQDWLVFDDDLTTNGQGRISYKDTRHYDFSHGYCNGHPFPPEPEEDEEEESDGDGEGGDEEGDEDDEYERLMEQWQEAVEECESYAESSSGTFHHWVCESEEEPSEGEAFEASGCEAARDDAYENFVNLEYDYTFRETKPRDGYTIHYPGHPDDIPVEIITTAASEAGHPSKWKSSSNTDIEAAGYVRNTLGNRFQSEKVSDFAERKISATSSSSTPSFAEAEDLLLKETYALPLGERIINKLFQFIGLPSAFARENKIVVKLVAEDEADSFEGKFEKSSKKSTPSQTRHNSATNSMADFSVEEKDERKTGEIYFSADEKEEEAVRTAAFHSGMYSRNFESGEEDSQPEAEKGQADKTAHMFKVYDHRASGQIHFNKRDMELKAGDSKDYDSYGDTQGDASLEGTVYGLFAADDIYGPDTQRDENGNVISGIGVIFDANDLVAIAVADRNGDGSFLAITERPHSIYNYKKGKVEYTGKEYPENLYVKNGYENGRIYKDNKTVNGDCWIGRPLILGNYYIKELSRSEGYELSITGREMEITNSDGSVRGEYGSTDASKTVPEGTAWITKQPYHAVTFPEGNGDYGNKENLLLFETKSKDAAKGYNVVLEGIPENADIYFNNITLNPVVIREVDGGKWIDAKEAPFYQAAESEAVYKRDAAGNMIEKPGAAATVKVPYEDVGTEAEKLPEEGIAEAEDADRFSLPFTASKSNIKYVKAELEQMMRNALHMETPKDGDYSTPDIPVYDEERQIDGKIIYGRPEIVLEIENITTNQSVIEAILHYYVNEKVFTYGGLQKIELRGKKAIVTVAAGLKSQKPLVYQTNSEGDITAAYLTKLNKSYGRYVVRKYTGNELSAAKEKNSGKYLINVTPDYEIDEEGIPTDKTMYPSDSERYLRYEAGETLYDYWYEDDGGYVGHAPVTRKVWEPVYKESAANEEHVSPSRITRVGSMEEVADPVGSTYVYYNKTAKQHTIHVGSRDMDLSGVKSGNFTIVLENGKTAVTGEDIGKVGANNVWGYKAGDSISKAEYIIRVSGAGAAAFTSADFDSNQTFIKNQRLIYNGYHNLPQGRNSGKMPALVEERIIGQQIKVTKRIDDKSYEGRNSYGTIHDDWFTRTFGGRYGKNKAAGKMDNFRFKVYLKSNLERLYRDGEGKVVWLDRNENEINIMERNDQFPALVNKIYTRTSHQGYTAVLEADNYDKFFDAVAAANNDKWDDADPAYTSWRPVGNAANRIGNTVENTKVSDMVRQFAVRWYLDDEVEKLKNEIPEKSAGLSYSDETYDKALHNAIIQAENYLKPFFEYDIDRIYSIEWDSAKNGGSDKDFTTLSADTLFGNIAGNSNGYYFAASKYLPYGTYIVVEQQPQYSSLKDFKNKHYQIDRPKAVAVPSVYVDYEGSQLSPEVMNEYYNYSSNILSEEMERKYKIHFNGKTVPIIKARDLNGDFEVYKYGIKTDTVQKCAGDVEEGRYAPVLVPWTVTASENAAAEVGDSALSPVGESSYKGFAYSKFSNCFFACKLRIEKMDSETGENILHDEALFALYAAYREEGENTDGLVEFYEKDTRIEGSREFLQAMGAENIISAGENYSGIVPAGTPMCKESEQVVLTDDEGKRTGQFEAFTTVRDGLLAGETGNQNTGYLVTPQPVGAGTYVLCEIKPPAGYVRAKPVAIEVYSDRIHYYSDGNRDRRVASAVYEDPYASGEKTSRIYIRNTPVRLKVSKIKDTDDTVTYRTDTRLTGTELELKKKYGGENLEFAYKNGNYLGYAWYKGTLEYLEARKAAGEDVNPVYIDGIFAGYGLITRSLDTADDHSRFVAGAQMILYDAIEVKENGNKGDSGYDGVEVVRDRNNNVQSMKVKRGCGGTTVQFIRKEDGIGTWTYRAVEREDTDILYYSLKDLKAVESGADGKLYGYDRNGNKIFVKHQKSIYILKGGAPVFELTGGDLTAVKYSAADKTFALDTETVMYHLDSAGNRDAYVNPTTGMAYTRCISTGPAKEGGRILVWPVKLSRTADEGAVIAREKIRTWRIASIDADTDREYMTGTWRSSENTLNKTLNPILNRHGLPEYYPKSEETYKKGSPVYDIDGDYVRYKYDDLLPAYNHASYAINNKDGMEALGKRLYHRLGESWIMENTWVTGAQYPNDPFQSDMTFGQPDMLKRVIPGTYIMEEVKPPSGYTKGFPAGVAVIETGKVQNIGMEDKKIKVEIGKIDAPKEFKLEVISDYDQGSDPQEGLIPGETGHTAITEPKGAYSYSQISGARLALYRARKVFTTDFNRYPKGYYLVKMGNKPAEWAIENTADNRPVTVTASWITDGMPKYFEGIPAGDYILEELEAAAGYVRSSMELTVLPTAEVQTFNLTNDHTKLEVYKYYEDAGGKMTPLPNSHRAELALYGKTAEKTKLIDKWATDDLKEYTETTEKSEGFLARIKGLLGLSENQSSFITDFEASYRKKGEKFTYLTWYTKEGKRQAWRSGSIFAGRAEGAVQTWITDKGSTVRITVYRNVQNGSLDGNGKLPLIFEYQFNYKEENGIKSYDTLEGMHRIDYLPLNTETYVLAEVGIPEGFEAAEPKEFVLKETGNVRRISLENKEKYINVAKVVSDGSNEYTAAGARLALFKADEAGNFAEDEKYLIEMWDSGTDGRYEEKDKFNGRLPEGFAVGDLKPHRISKIPYGIYYIAEIQAPPYMQKSEPIKITVGMEKSPVYRVINIPSTGKLVLQKKASDTGERLENGRFRITNKDTKASWYVNTGRDGIAELNGLPVGAVQPDGGISAYTYTIEEISPPDFYCISRGVKSFQFKGEEGEKETQFTYEIENMPTNIHFKKTDFNTGMAVEGAEIAIYEAGCVNGTYQKRGEAICTVASGTNGFILKKKLSAGRVYIMEELKAPDGYTRSKPVIFTVNRAGTGICKVSNDFNVLKLASENGAIEALTVTARSPVKVYTAIRDLDTGGELFPFTGTGSARIINTKDGLADGHLYEITEYTIYSDGRRSKSRREIKRIYLDETGTYAFPSRTYLESRQELTDENGNVLADWVSGGEETEYTVKNPVVKETPIARITGAAGADHSGVKKNSVIKYSISYNNPYGAPADIEVKAVLEEGLQYLRAEGGGIEEKGIVTWNLTGIAPHESGTLEVAAIAEQELGKWMKASFETKTGEIVKKTVLTNPVVPDGSVTVINKLTGTGKNQESQFCYNIKFMDSSGNVLSGYQAYSGSKKGRTKGEGNVTLTGDGFLTFAGLPYGTKYEITQEPNEEYQTENMIIAGEISKKSQSAVFKNNRENKNVREILTAGGSYQITETTAYSDGSSFLSGIYRFRLNASGAVDNVDMEDRPTQVILSKKAFTGQEELSGAYLSVTDENGGLVEEWVSGEHPYEVTGKLIAGERYKFHEIAPKSGYAYEKDVAFTVSQDGGADQVEMRDDVTKVRINKIDEKGRYLPGAVLQILDEDKNTVMEFETADEPFDITGLLTAGTNYCLREIKPPKGYLTAPDKVFWVPKEAEQTEITMTDLKRPEKEMPPDSPEALPDPPMSPEPFPEIIPPQEPPKSGSITACYEIPDIEPAWLELAYGKGSKTHGEKTGDRGGAVWAAAGMLFCFSGFLLNRKRKGRKDR